MFQKIKNRIEAYKTKKAVEKYYDGKLFSRSTIESDITNASSGSILVTLSKRLGLRFGDITSKDYEEGEYDLMEIDTVYDTESYVRQGFDKYLEQVFKEGYTFHGKNVATVEYINMRLLFIAEASQISTDALLTAMAEDVVKYSNAIILKARKQDETQLPPTSTVVGIDGAEPVVAYFPAHPGTFKIKRDKTNLVQGYQQEVDGGDKPVKFKATDVVHIAYKKKRGNAFGCPFIIPVLNDIKALRFLEENVINMVYKHVNPFIHVQVGDTDSPGEKEEVAEVERELNDMNPEAGFVSTNRVVINTVATNNAVSAREYLDYQEARVFTGMGVPGIAFGRGGTANRNTADALTAEMSDRIHAIQRTIESSFNNQIIKELLREGGFDPLINIDDMVYLEFKENDLDKKIKFENHCTFLFEHNAIDENEMRDAIGRDPIVDRGFLHHELYTMAVLQANLDAKAASATQSGGGSSSSSSKGKSGGASKKDTNNKNKPTNQSGTKSSPKKTTNSKHYTMFKMADINSITNTFNLSEEEAIRLIDYVKVVMKISNSQYFDKRIERIIKAIKGEV